MPEPAVKFPSIRLQPAERVAKAATQRAVERRHPVELQPARRAKERQAEVATRTNASRPSRCASPGALGARATSPRPARLTERGRSPPVEIVRLTVKSARTEPAHQYCALPTHVSASTAAPTNAANEVARESSSKNAAPTSSAKQLAGGVFARLAKRAPPFAPAVPVGPFVTGSAPGSSPIPSKTAPRAISSATAASAFHSSASHRELSALARAYTNVILSEARTGRLEAVTSTVPVHTVHSTPPNKTWPIAPPCTARPANRFATATRGASATRKVPTTCQGEWTAAAATPAEMASASRKYALAC